MPIAAVACTGAVNLTKYLASKMEFAKKSSKPYHCRNVCDAGERLRNIILCFAVTMPLLVCAQSALNCTVTVGTYRDCMCGVKWRDTETVCSDRHTYYQPVVTQENLTCDFDCLHGGRLFRNRWCYCERGFHGRCCETREFAVYSYHCG